MGTGTASSSSCRAFRGRPRSRSASAKPIPASTTQATKADWKPSVSTRSGFAPSFAARKSSERETATVVAMATPSAAELEGRVVEARGEPRLVLGDTRERRDRGGHEGEANL
jgi:hypothetical protein